MYFVCLRLTEFVVTRPEKFGAAYRKTPRESRFIP